jgi:endonuclease/exonuclease/phosphatase (EEP) superfamily protein YafD
LTLALIVLWIIVKEDSESVGSWVIIGLLLLNLGYLSYQIFPYTPLSKKQMLTNAKTELPSITAMVSNVYQYNRKPEQLIELIKSKAPDILLLVETDQWWKENVIAAGLDNQYKHTKLLPQENTYGMLLFSKHPLEDIDVRYLVQDHIPSITAKINHPDNGIIQLFAVHPEPPLPHFTLRATDRDAELLLIAEEARKSEYPVIVMGDLNDVAWSKTTDLFLKTSKLLDPRRGRGMFNTFHAKNPIFRWPLDHFFFSSHFLLNKLKVLPAIGSDHYPILADVSINLDVDQEHKKLEAQANDYQEAQEKKEEANS